MEFRFRAKHPATKRWMYFGIKNVPLWVEKDNVQQYTGVVDKKGNPIFDGDILSTDLSRPYLVVEFRNGAFMYQCHDSGKDYYDIMFPVEVEHDQDAFAEVIGNIFDNPELLNNES
ncbi:YopX family protein [Ornithinibacillus sp. JPR2-1]|uniref:YopX family protein n=1 Tax=Ornithinibacillus sp. JPR2-1 TaxID=2094019 RepID=UPI0031D6FE4C